MIPHLRQLTAQERTPLANIHLGATLAFAAGAINAGGFLAVGQYTSHMTGIVSLMADNVALGNLTLALAGLSALCAFLFGAISSTLMINWAKRRRLRSLFVLPLLLEAALLLVFGLLGSIMDEQYAFHLPETVILLCFTMGLQNALITKISDAEIRTTHITGLVTDFGVEIGRLVYCNRSTNKTRVTADRAKLRIQSALILMFIGGGIVGALGFKQLGYATTIPLALLLVALSVLPLLDDMRLRYRVAKRQWYSAQEKH